MLFVTLFLHSAHAFDWNSDNERSKSQRLEFGVCTGLSSECPLAGLKVGGIHESFGISFSVSPIAYAFTLSFRYYPKIDSPIQPYVYGGFLGSVGFVGGGSSPDGGVGIDIHSGILLVQPSIGISRGTPTGALSLLVKI